ncbi:GNAT family N-acetyltransferase [Agrobacterium tumefaciens]
MTDASPLARLTNDPRILRNLLCTAYPFEPDDARRLIWRIAERRLPVWAVDDGKLVGLIGLSAYGHWNPACQSAVRQQGVAPSDGQAGLCCDRPCKCLLPAKGKNRAASTLSAR